MALRAGGLLSSSQGGDDTAESSYDKEYEEVQCIGRGNFGKFKQEEFILNGKFSIRDYSF